MTDQVFTHQRSKNYGKVPSEVMHDTTLTDGAVRLYAHMHWRGGKPLQSFEGMQSMADHLGVGEKAISNRVKELESRNWLVVIYRIGAKGQYLTPVYHVFEYQADCIAFRTDYKVADDEELRQPSHKEERKSRKGQGGNPKLIAAKLASDHQNLSSDGRQNLSSDGEGVDHQNLSSDYPESSNTGLLQAEQKPPLESGNESIKNPDILMGDSSNDTIPSPVPNAVIQAVQHIEETKPPRVTAAQMTPMKNAIAAAFEWPKPTSGEWGKISVAAKDLILADVKPEEIPSLFKHCKDTLTGFGPNALPNHVSSWRKKLQPIVSTSGKEYPSVNAESALQGIKLVTA